MSQVKLGNQTLGLERPLIAVPLTDVDVDYLNNLRGADIAELRIDMFSSLLVSYVSEIFITFKKKFPGIPVIATCRSKEEGGAAEIADEDRPELFAHIIDLTDAVDIEIESKISKEIADLAIKHGKTLIASYHDFSKTPTTPELADVYRRGKKHLSAHIVKIAATPNNTDDIKRLAAFTLGHESVVTISMGEKGMASRIFLPFLGSLFTFASLMTVSAPGQLSIDELRKYYSAF
ncbi:MAG: type I 3-dehydroquinate dehydratase [Nitrospirae bacterium]|nr:type I 3-dehydroquinate dehydratase [Nitrospirota bacterium]